MDIEQYFRSFYAGTKNPSLAVMEYFMEKLGYPEEKLNVIHIAGTNGKGSVSEMMSNILVGAGYKTGKFMSPHLICYKERISINNQMITDSEMEKLILELMPLVEAYNQHHDTKVTLFELETTMAILYFFRADCDFVILETGLGGLYDCTNIVKSSLSILTSIGYDHMNLLGNTLEEIAWQKAGIIKPNGNTIFVKQAKSINKIIEDKCKEKENRFCMIEPKEIKELTYGELTKFSYKNDKNIEINLKGLKQPQNAAICLECVKILREKNYLISEQTMRQALKTVVHKGRFETICQNPLIIFDGAHNEPAITHLKDTIHQYYKKVPKVFIISIFDTKDYTQILEQILQEDAIFIFTDGNDEGRFIPKETLYDVASQMTNHSKIYKRKMKEAIRANQRKI